MKKYLLLALLCGCNGDDPVVSSSPNNNSTQVIEPNQVGAHVTTITNQGHRFAVVQYYDKVGICEVTDASKIPVQLEAGGHFTNIQIWINQ